MGSAETSGSTKGIARLVTPLKDLYGGILSFFRWFYRNRRIQLLFVILALAPPLILIIYGIVVPVKNYRPYPDVSTIMPDTAKSQGDNLPKLNHDQELAVKEIIRKENEIAFQQNRLDLASKDSIYVVLDLPDSLLILEIKGVTVKKARLRDVEVSHRFSLISHENLLPWISAPFKLERDLSTIPKSPIVIKKAPKDTIEAAQQSSLPQPPDSTNVFFTLYFDRNLVLEIEQADSLQAGNTEKVRLYRRTKRKESARSVFHMLMNPQRSDQPMSIKMWMSEDEARAIYRAIPSNTHLLLKL